MIKKIQIRELQKKIVAIDKLVWVITVMIVVALATLIYWTTRPNQQIVVAANQVVSLAEEVRRHYHNRPDYWRLNSDMAIKENVVPQAMRSDNKIKNALNGEVLIGTGFDGAMIMPGTRSFEIIYKNLTKKDCEALAVYAYNAEQNLGLLSVMIRNGNEESTFTWGGENKLPISENKAKSCCGKNSELSWEFE